MRGRLAGSVGCACCDHGGVCGEFFSATAAHCAVVAGHLRSKPDVATRPSGHSESVAAGFVGGDGGGFKVCGMGDESAQSGFVGRVGDVVDGRVVGDETSGSYVVDVVLACVDGGIGVEAGVPAHLGAIAGLAI